MKKIIFRPSTWPWIITYVLMSLLSKKREIIYDSEDVKNLQEGTIFILNHRNVLDPWIFFNSLPFSVLVKILPVRIFSSSNFQKSSFLLRVLDKSQIINFIYFVYSCIKVPHKGTLEEKISVLFPAIEKNQSVLIFPEGKVNNQPEISEIKEGIRIIREKYKSKNFFFASISYPKNEQGIRVPKVIFGDTENNLNTNLEKYDFVKYTEHVKNKLQNLYNKIR